MEGTPYANFSISKVTLTTYLRINKTNLSIELAKQYLEDKETIEKGSPLRELITKGDSEDLIPIIDYFWGRRKFLCWTCILSRMTFIWRHSNNEEK